MEQVDIYSSTSLYQYQSPHVRDTLIVDYQQSDGLFQLIKKESTHTYVIPDVKLAASCLLQPEPDDLVEVYVADHQLYILSILERASKNAYRYQLNPQVHLEANQGQLNISSEQTQFTSRQFDVQATTINFKARLFKNIAKVRKTISDFIYDTANNRSTKILEEDQLLAKNKHQTIKDTLITQSRMSAQKNDITNINTKKFNVNASRIK